MRWPRPDIDLVADPGSRVRRRRLIAKRHRPAAKGQRPLAIDRFAKGVDDPPEPPPAGVNDGLSLGDLGHAANSDAFQRAEWHQQGATIAEPDDLARHPALLARQKDTAIAYGEPALDAADFDQQAEDRRHTTEQPVFANGVEFVYQCGKIGGQVGCPVLEIIGTQCHVPVSSILHFSG